MGNWGCTVAVKIATVRCENSSDELLLRQSATLLQRVAGAAINYTAARRCTDLERRLPPLWTVVGATVSRWEGRQTPLP
ncbi:Hypothetical predicted protein [Olea europaea subsp. europaea]|uniref:Uncharacterized protein n=1 Tax=Olea europaea subsp. europaea TaxID=158383 RepID=A0A8S0TTB2_OLEEU|nr:Hypothetical predicted protein [Olea europaea subsp. europaea]